jgi:hypothetical protein
MVHEGVTWFHDANPASPVLTMALTIHPALTVTGQLVDLYGLPVPSGEITGTGGWRASVAPSGLYTLPLPLFGEYTLSPVPPSMRYQPSLPAHHVAANNDLTYTFAIVPFDFDMVITGGAFEEDLTNWVLDGSVAPTSTTHTGYGAASLTTALPGETSSLSQSISMAPGTREPHLSLFYSVPLAGEGSTLQASLISGTSLLSYSLPITVDGWTHFQDAIPSTWHGPLDFVLRLDHGHTLSPTVVLLDEVHLGYRLRAIYLPLALSNLGEPVTVTTSAGNN